MPDLPLECTDCGVTFVFSEPEQLFFAERALAPPKRCKACRRARRASLNPGRITGVRSSLPDEADPVSASSPPPRDSRTRYRIKCADCGTVALVPFKPVEGRAVYCPNCYHARKGWVRQATDGVEIDESDEGIIE
jgi:CxxC-x17-CxxC domain-containing protein